LSKSQKKNLKRKAQKKRKALEKASKPTTQLQPSLVVNHEVKRLSHEIMILLQRSSKVIHTSSFMRSKDGKKLVKNTQKLFNGDLAFSANQVLCGSKLSLKTFNVAQTIRDEYKPNSRAKDEPSSSKKKN